MQKKQLIVALLAGLAMTPAAQAVLIDRGGGLIYDDVLNITWLQDANYAMTSGYAAANAVYNGDEATDNIEAIGRMGWDAAVTWADTLVYHDSVRNVDYSDWRLPGVSPINGTAFNYFQSVAGTTDWGYNISAPGTAYAGATVNEMAYMYHNNLGLKSKYAPTAVYQPDFGIFGNGTLNGTDDSSYGQNNVGLIVNLQTTTYWSGTELVPAPSYAWSFIPYEGQQIWADKSYEFYAWAVRPGDVAAPVPEPEAYALMLAGLGLVGWAARRKQTA